MYYVDCMARAGMTGASLSQTTVGRDMGFEALIEGHSKRGRSNKSKVKPPNPSPTTTS